MALTTEDDSAAPVGDAPGRYFPGPVASGLMVLAVLGLLLLQVSNVSGDHAVDNILRLICGAVLVASLLVWFVFVSDYAQSARYAVAVLLGGLLLTAIAVLRVDQVNGDMVPQWRFAWELPADEKLAAPRVAEGDQVDLQTTTPLDFPEFLGPQRLGSVSTVRLDPDWQRSPPKMIWKQPIGAGWSGFAAVNGYAVTLEQRGAEELVTCYEIATGKLRWHHGITARHETVLGGVGPRSTPTIDGGRVYAQGATGVLRCLDGATGELVWSRDLLKEFGVAADQDLAAIAWGRAGSPLIVENLVVVPAGGPAEGPHVTLVAYDKANGHEAWRSGSAQISYSSPVLGFVGGASQIVSVNESSVSGHSPHTGAVLWTEPWEGSSRGAANTSQPRLVGDSVLVTKGYGQGAARLVLELDGTWNVRKAYHHESVLKTKLTSAVLKGDLAFGLSDGILECIQVGDGKRQWKGGRFGHGQILLVDDLLLVLSETGELHLVRATADRFEPLASIEVLEGKTWNTLCLYGSMLLVRNAEQAACYQLPLRASPEPDPAASPPG